MMSCLDCAEYTNSCHTSVTLIVEYMLITLYNCLHMTTHHSHYIVM